MKLQLATVIALLALSACDKNDPNVSINEESASANSQPSTTFTNPKQKVGDGPFGIQMGRAIAALDTRESDSPDENGIILLASVPKPFSEFITYGVRVFPEAGVCEVRAITPSFESDSNGVKVRVTVDSIAEALTAKYGEPRKMTTCNAYDCDSRFWLHQIEKNERLYSYVWENLDPSSNSGLSEILLSVRAEDMITSFAVIFYTFSNSAQCDKAAIKTKSEAL